MRVKQVKDVDGFFSAIAKCQGRVELVTDEHDVLNLASKLTQYIGLTRIFSNPEISAYEILCYKAEDYDLLKEYLEPAE